MGDTLDDELERQRRQEADRRAIDKWRRRYGAPLDVVTSTVVRDFPEQDRALITDFLRRAGRGRLRRGTVLPHPDGSKRLLTGNHASVYTALLARLRRRLEEVLAGALLKRAR